MRGSGRNKRPLEIGGFNSDEEGINLKRLHAGNEKKRKQEIATQYTQVHDILKEIIVSVLLGSRWDNENLICAIENRPFTAKYDGHSNCYIETGHCKGALIDFNYETEPLPGYFPFPGIGPFGLLKETRINHYGKLLFRWIYWHILLKGKELPISTEMTMAGKYL